MRADLHTHSIYSDGYYTPDELCRRAKENGVELLSVTDHDTMNGEEEKARRRGKVRAPLRFRLGNFRLCGREQNPYHRL